jgi:hypothetical protein
MNSHGICYRPLSDRFWKILIRFSIIKIFGILLERFPCWEEGTGKKKELFQPLPFKI